MATQTEVGAFEKIAAGIYLEGLSFDFKRDVVWYSDVIKGGIHGVTPEGKPVGTLNESRMWTGGVMMNECGAVLSSGEGGIMWNDPDTGKSGWLIDTLEGKPVNGINEMWPDGAGGIFFGSIDMERVIAGEDTRPVALYRLTVDREVIKLADGLRFTNGIVYDPERKRLYCNCTFDATRAFDVADDLSSASNQRVFVDKEDCDGMALDAQGNIWITGFRSQFLMRVSPDGTELTRIETPAGSITQVRFGGADRRDYYITVVPAEGGDTLKEGGELTSENSFLYRGRSDAPGVAIAASRFTLG